MRQILRVLTILHDHVTTHKVLHYKAQLIQIIKKKKKKKKNPFKNSLKLTRYAKLKQEALRECVYKFYLEEKTSYFCILKQERCQKVPFVEKSTCRI